MGKSPIGIEISSSEVSMIQLSGSSVKTAVGRMPENLVKDDKIASPELLAKFIKELKKKSAFSGSACAVVLPESDTFFRSLNVPAMSEEQLKLNLPYEFHDFIGNKASDYYYDYALERVNPGEDGSPASIDILAGAALKSSVSEYYELLRRAGLHLKIALPREMCVSNLMRAAVKDGLSESGEYCIVSIEYERTHIYIFNGGSLAASKAVDIGCRHIDAAIADADNTDIYLAASYRAVNHQNVLYAEACRSIYERISLEVMKTINFYKYENQQSTMNAVSFCGEGALVAPLIDEILGYIQFSRRDMTQLLPASCRSNADALRSVLAIGVSL